MNPKLRQMMAEAFETTVELLPYIPELLQDLWSLGSPPEPIIEMLQPLNLQGRALDLGCGKGALSISLAEELGLDVFGVDLCEEFLLEGHRKSDRVNFILADVCNFVKTARNFDLVVMASVGPILGGLDETVQKLRQCVKPGGYMLIDDGFLKTDIQRPGYQHSTNYAGAIQKLTSHGDLIVTERINPLGEIKEFNEECLRVITARAHELAKRQPELADQLNDYIENQKVECRILEEDFSCATWLLQKSAR